jgi:hypothetical protein
VILLCLFMNHDDNPFGSLLIHGTLCPFTALFLRKDGSRRLIMLVCVIKGLKFILKELTSDFVTDLQCCYY